jgi:hypothetical protein
MGALPEVERAQLIEAIYLAMDRVHEARRALVIRCLISAAELGLIEINLPDADPALVDLTYMLGSPQDFPAPDR